MYASDNPGSKLRFRVLFRIRWRRLLANSHLAEIPFHRPLNCKRQIVFEAKCKYECALVHAVASIAEIFVLSLCVRVWKAGKAQWKSVLCKWSADARVYKNTRSGDGRRLFMTHFKRHGRLSEFANEHLAWASKALPWQRRRKPLCTTSLPSPSREWTGLLLLDSLLCGSFYIPLNRHRH